MPSKHNIPTKAQKRITECRRTRNTYLDLSGCNLYEIPEEVYEMDWIEVLDLSPDYYFEKTFWGRLQKRILDGILRGKKIASYGDLWLKLHYEIYNDWANFILLQNLPINKNHLQSIDEKILQLPRLKGLILPNNKISEFPEHLAKLQQLQVLYLSNNQLSQIPEHLAKLQQLQVLSLSNNQLSQIPEHLAKLQQLQFLSLSNNQLSQIPDWLSAMPHLIELYLKGNPIQNIPKEIFDQDGNILADLQSHFASIQKEKERLFEAKLLIVGEGDVGKTSLKFKLEDAAYIATKGKIESTEGIVISQEHYKENWEDHEREFTLNVWDFGGQEVYHATHQFFLTQRSLYLLVWDSRKDTRQSGFDYWLNIIRLLGNNSPVLLIKNVFDKRDISIAESQWRQSFPNLKEFLTINCGKTNKKAMKKLWKAIKYQIGGLEHIGVEWGKDRLEVRRALEEKAKERPFIALETYLDICREVGDITDEKEAARLSDYLHHLGVILHFQDDDYLNQTVILRSEWGTAAVYKILDDPELQKRDGLLYYSDLEARIWGKDDATHRWKASDYPTRKYATLLRLMYRFELCFPIQDTDGKQYIVPELLEADEPKTLDKTPFEVSTAEHPILQFVFEYPIFMPKGIITRFMVRLYPFIENKIYWRRGVWMHYPRHNARATIVQNDVDKRIYIRTIGRDRKVLLGIIRQHIGAINATFSEQLKVNELIPCNCKECIHADKPYFYEQEQIKKYQKKGVLHIRCGNSLEEVLVSRLVNDTISSVDSKIGSGFSRGFNEGFDIGGKETEIPIPPPKVFIAYDDADQVHLENLTKHLNSLERSGELQTWSVNQTLAGSNQKKVLNQQLAEAGIILLLISVDFINSDTCVDHILKVAMQKNKAGSAWVVPIYVRPCDCDKMPFEDLEPLPNDKTKPQYVTLWENQDAAWWNVTQGIKKVLKS